MGYLRLIEYRLIPKNSFEIQRNCSGCGGKTNFYNTNRFRVNANGNKVDVWLIYQCRKCKHTYNLTIYERKNPSSIPKKEYAEFLCNSPYLAFQYGINSKIFSRNKAEIDMKNLLYDLELMSAPNNDNTLVYKNSDKIIIHNDYSMKVRVDKILSELLNISRNRVKQLIDMNIISISEVVQEKIIEILINGNMIE
jgi:hypothetical protein